MTPEEQRILAMECGIYKGTARDFDGNVCYYVTEKELAIYTAAAEAKERERCKINREGWKLVPIEPTNEMLEVYRTWQLEGLRFMDIGIIKAIIEAAPKDS